MKQLRYSGPATPVPRPESGTKVKCQCCHCAVFSSYRVSYQESASVSFSHHRSRTITTWEQRWCSKPRSFSQTLLLWILKQAWGGRKFGDFSRRWTKISVFELFYELKEDKERYFTVDWTWSDLCVCLCAEQEDIKTECNESLLSGSNRCWFEYSSLI